MESERSYCNLVDKERYENPDKFTNSGPYIFIIPEAVGVICLIPPTANHYSYYYH